MTRAIGGEGLQRLTRSDRVEAALWRKFRGEGDEASRMRLFDLPLPFAKRLARREYARRSGIAAELADFEQWAIEGLLQSLDRFDPLHGCGFAGFAKRRIAGNIANQLPLMSERGSQLGFRRRVERDRIRSLRGTACEGDDPLRLLAELAIGLATGLILEDASAEAIEAVPDETPSAYDSVAWHQLVQAVTRQIGDLPETEAIVIQQHYLNDVGFAQIAAILGLSRGRISQLHRSAIGRIRQRLSYLTEE